MDKLQVIYDQETGKLQIDLSELFSCMSDEESAEFVDKYALWYPVMSQIVYELKEGFSGENYNSAIYNLREQILKDKDCLFESMFTQQVPDLLEIMLYERKKADAFQSAYYRLYHFIHDKRRQLGDYYEDGLETELREAQKLEDYSWKSLKSDDQNIKDFLEWVKTKVK